MNRIREVRIEVIGEPYPLIVFVQDDRVFASVGSLEVPELRVSEIEAFVGVVQMALARSNASLYAAALATAEELRKKR